MTDYRGLVRDRSPETSWQAASKQTTVRVDAIKGILLGLYATYGAMTDDDLVARWEAYMFLHPSVQSITPQSIRTRRRALQTEGRVYVVSEHGRSHLGNRAQVFDIRTIETPGV